MSRMEGNERNLTQPSASGDFGRRDMFLCLLCALSTFVAVAALAGVGRGRAAALCAGVDFTVAKLRWESRRNPWFWCAISLILILQVTVISFVPFGGESMPVYGLVPAGLVVYLVNESIILLFTKGLGNSGK